MRLITKGIYIIIFNGHNLLKGLENEHVCIFCIKLFIYANDTSKAYEGNEIVVYQEINVYFGI